MVTLFYITMSGQGKEVPAFYYSRMMASSVEVATAHDIHTQMALFVKQMITVIRQNRENWCYVIYNRTAIRLLVIH